ncbi:MAG: chemotaxis protein CheW [Lachnospira sp.]
MADYIKPVVFKLGNQTFGIDINLVQSIEKGIEIVNVPNTISYISGIVNLRGEVIPAFSLRKKFNMPDNYSGEEKSTVIVTLPELKLALEVDDVLEISNIDEGDIVSMPAIAKTDDTQYLDRVASRNGKLIILLDIEKILTDTESQKVKNFTEELSKQ